MLEAAVQAAGLGEAGDCSDAETSLMEEIDQAGEFPPTKMEARRALLAFASLLFHNKVADSSDMERRLAKSEMLCSQIRQEYKGTVGGLQDHLAEQVLHTHQAQRALLQERLGLADAVIRDLQYR